MTVSRNFAMSSPGVEQILANDILAFLNPPQQNYAVLADRAWNLLQQPSFLPKPSVERALVAYFERFAFGYATWQGCYDYPLIHKYYYAAYLQALQEGGSALSSHLEEMFEQMTEAMIAYTHYENAFISNDAKGLLDSAKQAVKCGKAALDALDQSSLGPLLRPPIKHYLDMNINLWRGFELCAEMYLAPLKNEEISVNKLHEVAQILASLKMPSRELHSELNAHFSFAQRLAQAHAQRGSDLRVQTGTLLLRATGYLEDFLTERVFQKLAKGGTSSEDMHKDICDKTGLPIVAVRPAPFQDIFDTFLDKDDLEQVIFELSTENNALTFSIHDGERTRVYPVQIFQVCLAGSGAISVEFEILIEDASISHVRVLESLMGPHAGQFEFDWRASPLDVNLESTDYVDYFLKSRDWIKSIRSVIVGTEPLALVSKLTDMDSVLKRWKNALGELAESLPRGFTESPDQPSEEAKSNLKTLQECFLCMRDLAQKWLQEAETSVSSSLKGVIQDGKCIFPSGFPFNRLIDIVKEVWRRINYYLEDIESPKARENIAKLISFDANTGWATVLFCNSLTTVEHHRGSSKPALEWDYERFTTHTEFKGLIIENREARSGLDDWFFVATPTYQNLATIRSHEHDIMYVGRNRTFLFLPDDPQFLTDQYIQTARLVDNIRNLLLAFNRSAKDQINSLESFKPSIHNYDLLLSKCEEIEIFRIRSDKILDLLRACAVSKYQDHSALLKEMVRHGQLKDIGDSLEHNIATLGRYYTYITKQLKQKIDDRTHAYETRITVILGVVGAFSVISVVQGIVPTIRPQIVTIYAFLVSVVVSLGGIIKGNIFLISTVLLIGGVLTGLMISLMFRLRKGKR